jgi:hypothetical protein
MNDLMLHQILLKVERFVTNVTSKWTQFITHALVMPLHITFPKKILFYTHQSYIDDFWNEVPYRTLHSRRLANES